MAVFIIIAHQVSLVELTVILQLYWNILPLCNIMFIDASSSLHV